MWRRVAVSQPVGAYQVIAHSMPFSKIISSESGAREHYHVPKYQREYTWGKVDWERLLQGGVSSPIN